MKLGPVTKLDKKNRTTSKKNDNNVISQNCDVMAIFPVYGKFGAIWKPHSGPIVRKPYLTKTENRTKKSRTQLSQYWFENSTQIRRDINPIFRRDKISPFGQ